MPQSLLLVGPEGSGKERAALEIAVDLLKPAAGGGGAASGGLFGDDPAVTPDEETAARKVRQLAHPDLLVTFPAESKLTIDRYRELLDEKAARPWARVRQPGSAIIPIGDVEDAMPVSVRAVRRFVNAVPFEAKHRVVVIGDAHRMNRSAANALLKTLEEPPASAVIFLCTHQPHLLPATIRSRCARVQVPALAEDELASILIAAEGISVPEAARIAAVAGGNARRGFDLVDPAARELADWADQVTQMLLNADRPQIARAAERVAKGAPPRGGKAPKRPADASLAVGRDVAMRVIDLIAADLLALGRRDAGARLERARLEALPSNRVDPQRALHTVEVLLEARSDLARNVNVGLVLLDSLLKAESTLNGRAAAHA